MPASAVTAGPAALPSSGLFASCADLLDAPSPVCPGCGSHAPSWVWVRIDGVRVLTHDGDVICPSDRTFGYTPAPALIALGVAA